MRKSFFNHPSPSLKKKGGYLDILDLNLLTIMYQQAYNRILFFEFVISLLLILKFSVDHPHTPCVNIPKIIGTMKSMYMHALCIPQDNE